MAPQTATTDEDLLIISDDTSDTNAAIDDSQIEISLDEPEASAPKIENVIEFDGVSEDTVTPETPVTTVEKSSQEETIDLSISPEVSSEASESSQSTTPTESTQDDFSLDFGIDTQDTPSQEVETQESSVAQENTSLDLADVGQTDSGVLSDTVESSVDQGMNGILAETIAKLESRQNDIATQKDGKSTQVVDLKEQIQKLEEEVALHEGEIEELISESKKIDTNIKSLEKMKLDEDVTKEHNSKRVLKK